MIFSFSRARVVLKNGPRHLSMSQFDSNLNYSKKKIHGTQTV